MEQGVELIYSHFPDLTERQREQFAMLKEVYATWNEQINVISRKDIEDLYVKHVLHSLAIAKVMPFVPGTKVLDIGTGGGFPGIPLAILFPECSFHMVDSIGKKIKVVNGAIEALELTNATGEHCRAESHKQKYDFIVSRAVTRMQGFLNFTRKKVHNVHENSLKNGLLYLKGGDLAEELAETGKDFKIFDLSQMFEEPFFETKKVVYMRLH